MDTPDPHPAVPPGTPAGLTLRGDVGRRLISAAEFQQLADVPAAAEWLANVDNPNTRRAYRSDVGEFMSMLGIRRFGELPRVRRAHVIAWRKMLEARGLGPAIVKRAEALGEDAWTRLARRPRHRTGKTRRKRADVKARIVRERGYVNKRLNHEDVAEFDYRPTQCRETYRMVVVRKNISKMKGDLTLMDEIRYFFYITTRKDLSADQIVRLANARCDQENVIEQLKNGVNALRVPMYDLVSNWAYMVMAALAWNLKSWFAMMMHLKADRRKYIAMEFRRFIREMILLPCQVIRRARRTTLRIIGWQPTTDRLFSTWNTIERTRLRLTLHIPFAPPARDSHSAGTGVSCGQNRSANARSPDSETLLQAPRMPANSLVCRLQALPCHTRTAEPRRPIPTRLFWD